MPKLPRSISGMDAVRGFQRNGWVLRRLGSHIIMTKEGSRIHLSIPNHRTLDSGLLRALIRHSGLTVEEFISQL